MFNVAFILAINHTKSIVYLNNGHVIATQIIYLEKKTAKDINMSLFIGNLFSHLLKGVYKCFTTPCQ